MIFYDAITKVGKAILGDANFPVLKKVDPRVYHKYLKDDDKNNLYPIGVLAITSEAGTEVGDTKITVAGAKADSTNIYKYATGLTVLSVEFKEDLSEKTTWDGTSDITPEEDIDTVITVVECTADGKALKAGSVDIVVLDEDDEDDEDPSQE